MFAEIDKKSFLLLPMVLSTIGKCPHQGAINRPRGLNQHEFIWVREGSGDFLVDGEKFVLKKGEGVFIKGTTPHSYHISEGAADFFTCWFTFSFNGSISEYFGFDNYFRFDVPSFLNKETDALERFCLGESNTLSRSAALYSLISEIFSVTMPEHEKLEQKVRHYLESHYSEEITLDKVARAVGHDRYSLCHYYSDNCKQSVMAELLDIRLSKSRRFLKYTSDSVEQIGKMCGFDSPSYFSKRFKEKYGKTPREYRKSIV